MSRCFPFPPPGYEKKIRTEEAGSLIKEKHKEKKHKKEKKDKEKKEGKEKKDKEKSKDKHKEQKEKKEKHRDRKDKDRNKEKSRASEDKKAAGDREKLVTNTLQNNGNGESKFIQDLARRIRDEEATESQSPQKIDFPCGVTENNNSCPVPQTNHRKVDERRNNSHENSAMPKRSESAVLRVSSCMDQKGGAEVIVKPVEKKDQAKKKELQEKNHHRESVTKSNKPLDNEGIKKTEPKNITGRSSKEKKDERKEVINKNVQEKPMFVEGGARLKGSAQDAVDTRDFRGHDLSRPEVKNLTAEGILGKRKDLDTNGLLYENGFTPNKIRRPVASPISPVENGRKLGACQVSELSNPEGKEHRINGFINSQEPKSHPPVSLVKVKENGEVSAKKRPHSDLKYLDQILNVPTREELHKVDDDEQEWLFGSGVKLLKNQRADSATSLVENPQVWNHALRIESADIVALPYVVPF